MEAVGIDVLNKYFSELTDPRMESKIDHKLLDIIVLSICAVISGSENWKAIEAYGKSKEEWLKKYLELPNGIPSSYTIRRVFMALSVEEFEACFLKMIRAAFPLETGQVINIDGKSCRGSRDRANGKSAIHMVSAWASESGISLGQVKTSEKSNEITAIPELLDIIDVEGCTVTIDAMGCQRDIAKKIIDKGGDYVLSLKANQGTLHGDVELFFKDCLENKFRDTPFDFHKTVDAEHGRFEERSYWLINDINWLEGRSKWSELKSIGMVIAEREVDGKKTREARYYISSLTDSAAEFAKAVRGHWGIENSLHWVLDVAFREDECRIRKGNAPAIFSIIRHMALNLLKRDNSVKGGIKIKRMRAGWDNNYLLKLLMAL